VTLNAKGTARGIEQVIISSEFSGVRCEAHIRNATKGAIKLWLDTKIIPGTAAEVTFAPGFKESGTILYCRPDGKGFSAVISFHSTDPNRREERTDVSEPCVVLELGKDEALAMPSQVVNISRSGMGLVAKQPLNIGALVSVALANFIFLGEVRHCAQADQSSFRIGLSIEHQTPRTSEQSGSSVDFDRPREWAARVSQWVTRLFRPNRAKT
jgi:hypothetical protein